MDAFIHEALPGRVLFGAGRIGDAGGELERLGVRRALVLSTPEQEGDARALADRLGAASAGVFPGAAMHTPVDVTASALEALDRCSADGLVAIGGGSTIGLAKAIALRTDLPQIAIPTTYAGSEMTPIIGQTEDGRKTTQSTAKVLPETVIYDPELTYGLPAFIAGPSGMNAIAHAVEALYAEHRNPVTSMMAEESIRALGAALPALMEEGVDEDARGEALYGAWLAGSCLASVGMAVHHKLCHVLGGSFDLNHGAVHCLMIPYTAAFNRDHAPEAMRRVARALGVDDAPTGLHALMLRANREHSLQDFGLEETDLERAADLAVQKPYYNPRPVTRDGVLSLLREAWEGSAP